MPAVDEVVDLHVTLLTKIYFRKERLFHEETLGRGWVVYASQLAQRIGRILEGANRVLQKLAWPGLGRPPS